MLNLFPGLKCRPDCPLQGDSGDWDFGLHPFLLCQAISQYYKLHFLLFWVIQIKGKNSKIPCTMHHSDNKQTNKYKQNNINLYVYVKMKIQSFISHELRFLFHLFYFPPSCPYPGFCPLKANYPSSVLLQSWMLFLFLVRGSHSLSAYPVVTTLMS